jgi:hypothetical protein
VIQVIRQYEQVFSAKRLLDDQKRKEACALAKPGRGAKPKSRSDGCAQRTIDLNEPIPEIYEELISAYEQTGQRGTAIEYTDKASCVFGGAPRWSPTRSGFCERWEEPRKPRRSRSVFS